VTAWSSRAGTALQRDNAPGSRLPTPRAPAVTKALADIGSWLGLANVDLGVIL
jgi:hypothetical protein